MGRQNNPVGLDIYEPVANCEPSKPAIKYNPGKKNGDCCEEIYLEETLHSTFLSQFFFHAPVLDLLIAHFFKLYLAYCWVVGIFSVLELTVTFLQPQWRRHGQMIIVLLPNFKSYENVK